MGFLVLQIAVFFGSDVIPLVVLQSDPYPGSPVPEMPSDANPFLKDWGIKGNYAMRIINAKLVPIMIAAEGNDFFDRNHTEKASDHIANIIASHELGGFTTDIT